MNRWFPRFVSRFFLLLIPLILAATSILWLLYQTKTNAEMQFLYSEEEVELKSASEVINNEFKLLGADIHILSQATTLREWMATSDPKLEKNIQKDFITFSEQRKKYDQIRLISETGQEIIRINWKNGKAQAVPKPLLQDKSARYYVQYTLKQPKGFLYTSPIDLNIEHKRIEMPIKPVVRVGMPLIDDEGHLRGATILNYLGQKLLDRIKRIKDKWGGNHWILNEKGYWLLGPKSEVEWGFMYPDRKNTLFKELYPNAWKEILRLEESGQFVNENGLFTFRKINSMVPGLSTSHRYWILLSYTPKASFPDAIRENRSLYVITMVFIFVVLIAMSAMFAYYSIVKENSKRKIEQTAYRYKNLLDSAPDAVIIIDQNGLIRHTNQQALKWFGYDGDELIDQAVEVLMPDRFRTGHIAQRNQYIKNAVLREMGSGLELFGIRKNGSEFPIEISLSPLQTDEGLLITSIIRDTSERKANENRINRLNDILRTRTTDLEATNHELEAFSYSVSHDLRAPLRAIDGFSHVLATQYSGQLDDKGKDRLQRIRSAAQRMSVLIDGLLKLSRIARAELNRHHFDLKETALEAVEMLRQGDPDREVRFTVPPELFAYGDSQLMKIVLDNLIGNSWKFTSRREDAEIEVGIRNEHQDNPVYFVRDNGAGFDMAYSEKLFGAFQRLHDSHEFPGTGIGLATVQRIIHKHGGHIWAEG
ncbi:MAG: PAS domain S-box protein, partial [Candidatus Thiodiazotropha sp.]